MGGRGRGKIQESQFKALLGSPVMMAFAGILTVGWKNVEIGH